MRRRHLLGLATVAATAAVFPYTPARAASDKSPKVLLIGVDGLVADRIADADAPTLKGLQKTGLYARSLLYAPPMARTTSGPGWSTILTGVWPDKHRVVDNTFDGNDLASHSDWLSVAKAARPDVQTWAATDWLPIGDFLFGPGIDEKLVLDGHAGGYVNHDLDIAAAAEAHLAEDSADASFVYFGHLDAVGHADGAASQNYLDEIAQVDGYVTRLLDAIASRAQREEENWLIMMTTDHGHLPEGGHGGATLVERGTFILATGDGVAESRPTTTRVVDVAASALIHLGVGLPEALDGRGLTHAEPDVFQTVTLRAAETEQIDTELMGWSPQFPEGWDRDTGAMPEGGVPEWAGWSLVTDAFWSAAHGGQNRENFTRSRGVFAVADCDEWADANDATDQVFDATLWTPSAEVGAIASVSFTSYYRQTDEQRGQLLARWDDGEPTVVETLSSNAHKRTTVTFERPSGASRVRVGFRLVGVNDWYWAIGDVRLG